MTQYTINQLMLSGKNAIAICTALKDSGCTTPACFFNDKVSVMELLAILAMNNIKVTAQYIGDKTS